MKKLFRPFSITWGKMPTAKPQTRIAIPTKTETKVFASVSFLLEILQNITAN